MELSIQILATSIPIGKEYLRYKVKTWWAHVDIDVEIEPDRVILVPPLPMIQRFYDLNGRETTVFVEMWYANVELFPLGAMRFLGLVKQRVDNQLRNPAWNPTVEWLEVYDPIEDIIRGRLLLKIDAKFIPSATPAVDRLPAEESGSMSAYFNNSFSHTVIVVDKQNKNNFVQEVDDGNFSPRASSVISSSSSSNKPATTNVLVAEVHQMENKEEVEVISSKTVPQGCVDPHTSNAVKTTQKDYPSDRIDLDLEIAKAKLDLALRDRERRRKLLEQKMIEEPLEQYRNRHGEFIVGSKKSGQDGRIRSVPDTWGLQMSPTQIPIPNNTSTPINRCRQRKSASNNIYETTDSEVDDVIHLLNNQIKIKPLDHYERTRHLTQNIQELKRLELDIQHARPKDHSEDSQGSSRGSIHHHQRHQRVGSNSSPARRPEPDGPNSHHKPNPSTVPTHRIIQEDLTIYGCGLHVRPTSKNPSNEGPRGPKTSLNYPFVQEKLTKARANVKPPNDPTSTNTKSYINNSNSEDYNNPSTLPQHPPISRKCAAKFDQCHS